MMAAAKRLYRSDDKMIGGVCSGIAEYFNIDPTIVRIVTVVLLVISFGTVLLIYLLLWVIMPTRDKDKRPIDVDPVSSDTVKD